MKRLAIILLLCVCLPAGSSSQNTASRGSELLIGLEADFAGAVAEHGRAAFVTYFAEDGVELQDGGGITTREEMKKQQPWPDGTSLTWTPVHADMAGTGDLGYTYGNYVFKSKDKAGKVAANYGKYVSIWKKRGIQVPSRNDRHSQANGRLGSRCPHDALASVEQRSEWVRDRTRALCAVWSLG